MDILIAVLTVADVLIALLLICLILVQQSKDSGFGSAFGGLGESVFGAQTGSHLAKMTVVFASLFLAITLALAIMTGHRKAPKSIVEELETAKDAKAVATAPAKAEKAPLAEKTPEPAKKPETLAVPEKKTVPALPPADK
ncbi:MAG TPA: preprotein translocase subunit SecG [Lentisphaeria bacterium]|nr:MAG: preprotein translocase subunit SecG [Lentisphaerae bacterium GWF2_50_93]HCE43004.1 preprotein translocase subunit SecG [Lentisphaeria bacterium]